jgi:hypothetical protein
MIINTDAETAAAVSSAPFAGVLGALGGEELYA